MATIGLKDGTKSNCQLSSLAPQYLTFTNNHPGVRGVTLTPKVDEEVIKFAAWENTDSNGNDLDLAIYDITNGVGDCDLVGGGSFSVTGNGTQGWREYTLTDAEIFTLTAGQTYAIAMKAPGSFFQIGCLGSLDNNCSATHGTLDGPDAWPSNWVGDLDWNGLFYAYAETRIKVATRINVKQARQA